MEVVISVQQRRYRGEHRTNKTKSWRAVTTAVTNPRHDDTPQAWRAPPGHQSILAVHNLHTSSSLLLANLAHLLH